MSVASSFEERRVFGGEVWGGVGVCACVEEGARRGEVAGAGGESDGGEKKKPLASEVGVVERLVSLEAKGERYWCWW